MGLSESKQFDAAVILAVGGLCEMFGKQISPMMTQAYKLGLEGLTPAQIEYAYRRAVQSLKFMPSAAELRELSGELRITDRAEKAWQAWEAAIRQHGGYKTLDFDDPAINATIRSLGGVQHLLDQDDEQYNNFTRKAFLKAYEAYFRMGVTGDVALPLLGSTDSENQRLGYPTKEPIRIVTGLEVKERPAAARIESGKREQFLTLKKA